MNTHRRTSRRTRLLLGMVIAGAIPVTASLAGDTYTIGGQITGLVGQGLTLTNGSDALSPNPGDQSFAFNTAVAAGTPYDVTVQLQPAGQTCTVLGGKGVIGADAVSDIQVSCASTMYAIGGTISGLTAQGLTLTNGADTVSPSSGDATFTFPTSVPTATSFNVTVAAQPAGQICTVTDGVGVILTSSVDNVSVSCTAAAQ